MSFFNYFTLLYYYQLLQFSCCQFRCGFQNILYFLGLPECRTSVCSWPMLFFDTGVQKLQMWVCVAASHLKTKWQYKAHS